MSKKGLTTSLLSALLAFSSSAISADIFFTTVIQAEGENYTISDGILTLSGNATVSASELDGVTGIDLGTSLTL